MSKLACVLKEEVGVPGTGVLCSNSGVNSSTSGLGLNLILSCRSRDSSSSTLGSLIDGVNRLMSANTGVMISSELLGSSPLGCVVRKKKTFLGCTGISSLAIGHGDNAVHGLFIYCVRREDSNAAGFAEL